MSFCVLVCNQSIDSFLVGQAKNYMYCTFCCDVFDTQIIIMNFHLCRRCPNISVIVRVVLKFAINYWHHEYSWNQWQTGYLRRQFGIITIIMNKRQTNEWIVNYYCSLKISIISNLFQFWKHDEQFVNQLFDIIENLPNTA